MFIINWNNIKLFLIILFTISCSPRIDFFSNPVDLEREIIYLTKIREDSSVKDKYYLTFKQVYEIKEHEIKLKNKTLERYLKLIMSYYGYSEKKIISRKNKNFLKPLFYVTVQFN